MEAKYFDRPFRAPRLGIMAQENNHNLALAKTTTLGASALTSIGGGFGFKFSKLKTWGSFFFFRLPKVPFEVKMSCP
jgi:hypothetical protein